MWSLLRTRRWVAFTSLVLIAIVGFGLLSRWQWQRADERRLDRQAVQAQTGQPVIDIGAAIDQPVEWEPVVATGIFDSTATKLVRQRPLDGANGFWVLTPLATADGEVWVNRGWIPTSGVATARIPAPSAPAGEVTVQGYVRLVEESPSPAPDDLPQGQVVAVSPQSWERGSGEIYIQAATSSPPDTAVVRLGLPEIDEGRNVSYAVQWIVFALVAMVGWFFFLRREARDLSLDEREDQWTSN